MHLLLLLLLSDTHKDNDELMGIKLEHIQLVLRDATEYKKECTTPQTADDRSMSHSKWLHYLLYTAHLT